jgi:hypothetical protein
LGIIKGREAERPHSIISAFNLVVPVAAKNDPAIVARIKPQPNGALRIYATLSIVTFVKEPVF